MRVLTIVLFWLSSVSCNAETPKDKNSDFLAIGSALLGQPLLDVYGYKKSESCFASEDKDYVDCEYTDQNGVSYLVEGSVIIRKEIRFSDGKAKPKLPMGLHRESTLSEAITKISNSDGRLLVWHLVFVDGDTILNTGFVTKNAVGQERDFYIVFDEQGVMKLIGERINWQPSAQEARAQLSKEFRASIDEARQLGADGDIDGYIDGVRSGGIWDFKSRREFRNLEGIEDFGNFAFGATGAAWADGYTGGLSNQYPELTTNLLMRGAGAYQEFFQSYNPSDGHFYDFSPPAESNYGDQFRDQKNIHTGAQYYFRRRAGE